MQCFAQICAKGANVSKFSYQLCCKIFENISFTFRSRGLPMNSGTLDKIAEQIRYKDLAGFFKGNNTTIEQFGFNSNDLYDQGGACESSLFTVYEAGGDSHSGTIESFQFRKYDIPQFHSPFYRELH